MIKCIKVIEWFKNIENKAMFGVITDFWSWKFVPISITPVIP